VWARTDPATICASLARFFAAAADQCHTVVSLHPSPDAEAAA
jgi:hypothetical protein